MGHCRSPIRPPFPGGLEALTWYLSTRLAQRGHEVVVFAAAGSDCGPGTRIVTPDDLGVRVDPGAPWEETRDDVTRAYEALVRHLPELGVGLVHNHSLNPTVPRLRHQLDVPVLTTLHTPPLVPMLGAFRLTPPHPGEVVAVSAHTARSWRRALRGGLLDPEVVHNGVDTDAWPLGPGGDSLVWFGRLVPEKGPGTAIDMARHLGMPLRLVGPRSDPAWFDEHIRPRLGDGVEYLGHLDTPQLAEVVGQSAATLVTPQWDEPFGLIAAESAACGTPVISLRRGGLPEVVSSGTGHIVPADDWSSELDDALAGALALNRSAVRREVEERLGLDRMVDAYESHYEQLLSGTAPGAHPGLAVGR
ncbi:glycosyltransferase family 4 protein [Kytococcus sedentarius]|uniref:glycosyltransferase family 4 protein n=1 Tax=Kytococcus sedentarius TaxID=1276 RepID=UPI0035BC75CF